MDADFWLDKWAREEIGFHQADYNPHLVAQWPRLAVPPGGRIFVPLCGKTHDIEWLWQQGYWVLGVELSEAAIIQLFQSLNMTPEVSHARAA